MTVSNYLRVIVITCSIFNLPAITECNEQKGGVTIALKRQKTPFEQHLNAPDLKKYGLNLDWFSNRTNDSIALYRYLDNEFYGQIVIGQPGQTLNVAFDTSWPLSWVLSSRCYSWSTWGCLFHNKYDDTKSSTFKPDGRPFHGNDGPDVFSGIYAYENISIAHSKVLNYSFVEMEEVPRSFIFNKIDGVLGLGQKYNESYNPFFYTLLAQGNITDPVFCVYLNRDRQSKRGGNVIMGFIEYRHVHSRKDQNNKTIYDEIKYLNVEPSMYWQFQIDGISLNDPKTPVVLCQKGCTGITDTSSNSILGPKDEVDAIHRVIKSRPFFMNRFRVECDTVNKLPKLDFTLGGQNFTLKGTDYTIKMSYFGVTICLSAFVPQKTYPENFWVLGGAFLAEVYTIYNVQDKQIGFVKAA